MSGTIVVNAARKPPLDPGFVPAVLWNRAFGEAVAASGRGVDLGVAVERGEGTISTFLTKVFPHEGEWKALNVRYVERLVKTLLWSRGGWKITVAGDPGIADAISTTYSPNGAREFDYQMIGASIYGMPMKVVGCDFSEMPEAHEREVLLGGNFGGCRIGFDLGGSDRKGAALIDGEVVFSEEIGWDPYFQKDPAWHKAGINDTLKRCAAKLPRVDAIGGSAAGAYVDNKVRAGSLYRGISAEDFRNHVVNMFTELQEEWSVPFVIVNDGEVTALAGAMSMDASAVLGVSMGTSQAAGYVNDAGNITDWLNELAFVPVDYREDAPADEWSGDIGCGVQYFSQQAVARLAPAAGLNFREGMPFPEQLVEVQKLMAEGDDRAKRIYETIGVCFGYAIAHYADFYDISNLLILGRVTSGEGGDLILSTAEDLLKEEFPKLAGAITFRTPDEKSKRHGQAAAAASLPTIERVE